MTTVQQRTEGFSSLGGGKATVVSGGLYLSPEKAMPRIEDGATRRASGSGDYVIDLANLRVDAKAYAAYKTLGQNGQTTTFEGHSERLEKAAHGKDGRLSRLLNAVKAPFKPKTTKFINSGKGANSGR